MLKKLVSCFLAIVLFALALPVFDGAAAYALSDGDYSYTVDGGKARITGYSGSGTSLALPSKLGSYPVASISSAALSYNTKLTGITIPASVTEIDDGTFLGCSSLSAIDVESGNTKFKSVSGVLYSADGKKLVCYPAGKADATYTVSNSVSELAYAAFAGCSKLTGVNLPVGLSAIPDSCFADCTALSSLTIPDGTKSIGDLAFANCTALKTVVIPRSVVSMGKYTNLFYSCPKVAVSCFSGSFAHNYCTDNGVSFSLMFDESSTGYVCMTAKASVYETAGGTTIVATALNYANYSFTGAKTIGSTVWYNVTIGSVKGWVSGKNCTAKPSEGNYIIVTGNNLYLKSSASASSSNITIVYKNSCFPYSATTTVSGTTWYKITVGSKIGWVSGKYSEVYSGVPDAPTLTSGSIGSTLKWVFDVNGTLTVTGKGAIPDFTSGKTPWASFLVSKVIIGSGVTGIGANAFSDLSKLSTVELSSTVSSIDTTAFADCAKLSAFSVSGSYFSVSNGVLYNAAKTTLVKCPAALTGAFTIPSTVKTISTEAFSGCTGLSSITIPSSVTTIETYAFSGCTGLKSVTIPSTVTSLGSFAFYACSGITNAALNCGGIGTNVFDSCTALTSVSLPSSMRTLPDGIFSGCTALVSVSLPSGLTRIGAGAFRSCAKLSEIDIPSKVTEIGSSAFEGCVSLTRVALPTGLTTIGYYAFRLCSKLSSLTLGDAVSSIGANAFYGCSMLTINCTDGSAAHKYCVANSVKYSLIYDTKQNISFVGVYSAAKRSLTITVYVINPETPISAGMFVLDYDTTLLSTDMTKVLSAGYASIGSGAVNYNASKGYVGADFYINGSISRSSVRTAVASVEFSLANGKTNSDLNANSIVICTDTSYLNSIGSYGSDGGAALYYSTSGVNRSYTANNHLLGISFDYLNSFGNVDVSSFIYFAGSVGGSGAELNFRNSYGDNVFKAPFDSAKQGGALSAKLEKGVSYTLVVSKPGHTRFTFSNFVAGTSTLPESIRLYAGDVNGDNYINSKDHSLLSAAYGASKGQGGFNVNADFNEDGVVNAKDRAYIAANFGLRGTSR